MTACVPGGFHDRDRREAGRAKKAAHVLPGIEDCRDLPDRAAAPPHGSYCTRSVLMSAPKDAERAPLSMTAIVTDVETANSKQSGQFDTGYSDQSYPLKTHGTHARPGNTCERSACLTTRQIPQKAFGGSGPRSSPAGDER